MWIKICGTTNLGDALAAVEAGADALGFVFAESARRVTAKTVAEITRHLPANVEKIGVFVAETPDEIKSIADQAGLTAVQLNRPVAIPGIGVETIPVLHMSRMEFEQGDNKNNGVPHPSPSGEGAIFDNSVKRLLLDSGSSDKGGGTGKRFDWERASRFLKSSGLEARFKIIVAGGLAPDNVAEAIRVFRPFGVDVVSGVEREKGRKDPDKVRAFIAAARAAERELQPIEKVQL
jgi:phosphoribosylanthranilate isomerase